ncbi:YncE family protein [Nocardia rhizosphaerihabitans]|uniref:YncE family protein n=1 Tax=Nocardia rhizosphaerihabitans TaxID=1691570 RepID=UPI003670F136
MRPRGSVASALFGAAALVVLTGCAGADGPDVPTRDPATAAVSPATATSPAGQVVPAAATKALLAERETGRLAALDTAGTTLTLLDPAAPATARTVTLPAAGAALAQGTPGEVLVAAPDRVLRIDVAAGTVTEIPVDGDVHSVQTRTDGTLIVGTADGTVRELRPDGSVARTVTGLVSADVIALTGADITVLDRKQTAVVSVRDDALGLMLRAGDGAANAIADPEGRIIVTDTAGGELLVYSAGPLVLRQRFPVSSSPYALAYDPRSNTVWVTCTESNEVVGYDLSTGIGVEVGRFPTVRQPDAVTVDERTGDLFVASATGEGLQRIGVDERKRGQ